MKASFRVAAPSTADYDTDDNKPTDQHNTLPTSMTVLLVLALRTHQNPAAPANFLCTQELADIEDRGSCAAVGL